jgi:hypothetical protein
MHVSIMMGTQRVNIISKARGGHRETVPQALEQVCSTTYWLGFGLRDVKNKGASAVKLLRPLKLIRKVFTLPGSI